MFPSTTQLRRRTSTDEFRVALRTPCVLPAGGGGPCRRPSTTQKVLRIPICSPERGQPVRIRVRATSALAGTAERRDQLTDVQAPSYIRRLPSPLAPLSDTLRRVARTL